MKPVDSTVRALHRPRSGWTAVVALLVASGPAWTGTTVWAQSIVSENALPGTPPSQWDISGAGDSNIQGFATDISYAPGETVDLKIDTDSDHYKIVVYRMGWYGGMGARRVDSLEVSLGSPQVQPAPLSDAATGLVDCGNWAVSASWPVPMDAVSGIYFAKLERLDATPGASHVAFVVRDDTGGSDLLFQTADTTWQAYNTYGGNSLYSGNATTPPAPRAHKLSYNRPFVTRGGPIEDWVFNAEYPMVRFLERNGYDVSYSTGVDTDRRGAELLEHRVYLSVGHDEYWSAGQRAAVEAARAAGVHLAFFSGNEIYWKTRWEASTDGSNTPFRTLVCYKEGTMGEIACGGKCDPLADTWTGLWRDGCTFSPPADGCRPENALSGQISWHGTTTAIEVPGTFAAARFWRHTSIASLLPNQTATLSPNTLGYEWNFEQFASSYPPGRVRLSTTVADGLTHHLSLYRHSSGALVFGAGTVQWSWGLDGTHDRGASTPDPRMQQATVNLFADMGAMPASLQAGLVLPTPDADSAAPTSMIGFPIDGGTVVSGIALTVSGTATETMGGIVAGVEVSVDGGATWAAALGTTNWTFAWTPAAAGPATLRSRAVDDLGNLEIPGPGITVTIEPAPPAACPCRIWAASTVPGTIDANDGMSVEVGVKFRSDDDGFISGIRFYKSAANTGAHVGKLWTMSGALLASATFTSETGSGWQEVLFGAPVAIIQDTTYVASVFMPNGHYSHNGAYFTNAGFDNPPLHALQNGVDGPNGVYVYGAGGFPTETFNASNYWVDVVFETTAEPDEVPPVIVGISPGNGANGVSVNTNVTVSFNEAMMVASLDMTSFELRDPGSALVPASVSYSSGSQTATLDPSAALLHSTTYTATVRGGAMDPRVKDEAGNALAADQEWSFTTAAPPPPPPDEGPGGPILVVATSSNPFGRYFAEILRCEGLNAFNVTDVSLVTPAVLTDYDVVLLGETPLTGAQVTMFSDWVTAGGNLIAMRPDPQLAPLLGLVPQGTTLSNGYLLVDTGNPPGTGIVGQTIQFHGIADRYTLSGATAIATLYSNATTATANPAVTLRSVGSNGGQAAAFTYDLARSVVYTRQGNPAWAGQERDGTAPLRSNDLFFGAAAGDPQPDWIDLDKVAIPQADEQQRLLANLVLHTNHDRKPLPRFWYLPRALKAAVVMTGDDHGSGGTVTRYDTYVAQSPGGCSLPDWECVRATSYIYPGTAITDVQAAGFDALGFETALHLNTGCADWTPATLPGMFSTQMGQLAAQLPSIPAPITNRTHCIAWSDWATKAQVSASMGIRFDTNYYYWPAPWVQDRPGLFTGSGMPMRFAALDGTMIDCYQAVTQMTDESGQSYPFTIDTLLDRALGAEGYYGVFTANMHTDSGSHAGSDAIVASALARDVPVVAARQMLQWLDGRNGSSFGSMTWSGSVLGFTVAVGSGANNLRGMLPASSISGPLAALTRNSLPAAYTLETIKGVEYALFDATAGSYEATYQADVTPPAITSLGATPGTTTCTVTWTTNEAADSHLDYGTSPGSLSLVADSATLETAHSLVLTGLTPSTTYYYRATSEDAAANAATSPALPDAPASFTTLAMPAGPCVVDDTVADFAGGTPGADTYVAPTGDGEVILTPAVVTEFPGTALQAGWSGAAWGGGGTVTVAGGTLTLDGARAGTDAAFGPERSLEFVATFTDAAFQHVGFVADFDFNSPWAIFSTLSGGNLYARTSDGTNTLIPPPPVPGTWFGTPHLFRVDWSVTGFAFYVDGALVATHAMSVGGTMRPLASDLNVGAPMLTLDWVRMSPYPGTGTFVSRVFDAGAHVSWDTATWSAITPAGTSVAIRTRIGSTPVPDGSWSTFTLVPSSGSVVGGASRYLQYSADLTASDPNRTPVLEDLTIECAPAVDGPPIISNIVATPDANGTTATVQWTTNEPADTRVDYGTSAGLLDQSSSSATFVLSHSMVLTGLVPNTTYFFRVTSADPAANSTTEPESPAPPLSFTTPAAACFADLTAADFAAGMLDAGTAIALAADGEVILAPSIGTDFTGTSLPPGWDSFPWGGGGSATVSGGLLTVDGVRVNTIPGPGFSSGRSLEFVGTFAAVGFQHMGFGGGNDVGPGEIFNTAPWAIFSTGTTGAALQARTWDGGSPNNTTIPGNFLGTPHRYRIDWSATGVAFSIDDTLRTTHVIALAGPMRPAVSDFATGGGVASVDWIRMTPYASSGTFLSRVFDAGGVGTWVTASWSSSTPAGTSLDFKVRTGNTAAPDGSWTPFVTIPTSGGSVGANSRYIQYEADLATVDPDRTPELRDVSITCSVCSDVTPPAAVTALTATPVTSGNDADGTTQIALAWPAVEPGASLHLYRKGFGNYPEYDDEPGAGAVPAAPASPSAAVSEGWTWVATLTGLNNHTDESLARDFWYYVAFVQDACDNTSDVSNRTDGTLNYLLGDVSDGVTPGIGDNSVSTEDLSDLGAHYGAIHGQPAYANRLDFGPTTDQSASTRPTTDNKIDFEDLVLLAVNYQFTVAKGQPLPSPAAQNAITLWVPAAADRPVVPGSTFDARVWMEGDGSTQAVSVDLQWNASIVEPVAQHAGQLLEAQVGPNAFLSTSLGSFDAALLGRRAQGIASAGVLATVTFRVLSEGDPGIELRRLAARDAGNHSVAMESSVQAGAPETLAVPRISSLHPNVPNPFNPMTTLRFGLASAGHVTLRVYSIDGRLVRTLVDENRTAGTWSVIWDGKDAAGRRVSSGAYLAALVAPDRTQTQRMTLLK